MIIKKLKSLGWIKLLIWIGVINLLILSALAAYSFLHMEKPDPGRDAFYASDTKPIPDNQNIAIALAGLNAPAGVDVIGHGRFVTNTYNKIDNKEQAKKIIEAKGVLSFVGDTEALDCWLDDAHIGTYKTCADAAQVTTLIASNDELLQRYMHLNELKHWQGNLEFSGQLLLNLNRLLAAQIKLDIDEGRPEQAYQKWRNNFLLINRAIRQETTMIGLAVFLVSESINLNILEYCLFKSPEMAILHGEELSMLLKPSSLARYSLKGVMRAEYKLFDENLFSKTEAMKGFQPEYFRNRLYRFHLDFLKRALLPPATFDKSRAEMKAQYDLRTNIFNLDWLNPRHSVISKLATGGFIPSFSLIESMHSKNAHIKLLNLSLKIRQQNIAPAEIQVFLNQAGVEYNNPFTNLPMRYDASKKVILSENPSNQNKVEVRL